MNEVGATGPNAGTSSCPPLKLRTSKLINANCANKNYTNDRQSDMVALSMKDSSSIGGSTYTNTYPQQQQYDVNDSSISYTSAGDSKSGYIRIEGNNKVVGNFRISERRKLSLKLTVIAVLTLIFSIAVLRARSSALLVTSTSYGSSLPALSMSHRCRESKHGHISGTTCISPVGTLNHLLISSRESRRRLDHLIVSLVSLETGMSDLGQKMGITSYFAMSHSTKENSSVMSSAVGDIAKRVKKNMDNTVAAVHQAANTIISSYALSTSEAINKQVQNELAVVKNGQYGNPTLPSRRKNIKRREAIIDGFMHSWSGYQKYAFGYDELMPVSRKGRNWNAGAENGLGVTIIDAITTMHIMGLHEELAIALNFIRDKLRFKVNVDVSVFESTIRMMGGLLSIYELTDEKHQFILDKAKELGDILLQAFNTSTAIPHATINFNTGRHFFANWYGGKAPLAEIGTLQLEFRTLSFHTGDPIYDMKVTHLTSIIDSRAPTDYLCPVYMDANTGQWATDHITFGSMGDSFYEYLIKQYLLTNRTEKRYAAMTRKMIKGVSKLMFRSKSNWLYLAESRSNHFDHKMEHLACFMGGTVALSSQELPDLTDNERDDLLRAAGELTETCVKMYTQQQSGLSPEFVRFSNNINDHDFVNGPGSFKLRPETIESLFYMWRYTKDQKWRDYGWDIFRSIDRFCRVESGGYSGIREVNVANPPKDDLMHSFWFAETMKYLYLLFADDSAIDLQRWVFNTEAHPFRRRTRDPIDLWRQYEAKHGSVPWFPPSITGVIPIETEKMAQMRMSGAAKEFMEAFFRDNKRYR